MPHRRPVKYFKSYSFKGYIINITAGNMKSSSSNESKWFSDALVSIIVKFDVFNPLDLGFTKSQFCLFTTTILVLHIFTYCYCSVWSPLDFGVLSVVFSLLLELIDQSIRKYILDPRLGFEHQKIFILYPRLGFEHQKILIYYTQGWVLSIRKYWYIIPKTGFWASENIDILYPRLGFEHQKILIYPRLGFVSVPCLLL